MYAISIKFQSFSRVVYLGVPFKKWSDRTFTFYNSILNAHKFTADGVNTQIAMLRSLYRRHYAEHGLKVTLEIKAIPLTVAVRRKARKRGK